MHLIINKLIKLFSGSSKKRGPLSEASYNLYSIISYLYSLLYNL
jgi:hypothetical protein